MIIAYINRINAKPIMKTALFYFSLIMFTSLMTFAASNVAGISGNIQKDVTNSASDPAKAPVFTVVSAGITSDPVFTGQIVSTGSDTIEFEASSDESEVTVNPFTSGVFHENVKTPVLTASLSGSGVGAISVTYAGAGFSAAPEVVIEYPTSGDDQATATASINGSGEISSITVTYAGSGYSDAPSVSIVGGPHFVKLTESGDTNEGRVFRIKDNNATRLTLDTSRLESGESLSNVLQTDYSVEVLPASTLGSVFGYTSSDLDLSPSSSFGSGADADYVYLYIMQNYYSFCFMPEGGGNPAGWYSTNYSTAWGILNDLILYPDEAFIVAKRTNGTLTIDFDGVASTSDQKMQLPAYNDAFVMNNPYGTDMILGELIPSKDFGTTSREFRPGSSDTDTNSDQLYFLDGAVWSQFYYRSGVNDGVTQTATATAKAGTAANNGLADGDVSLAGGNITNLESCNAVGASVDHNVSIYTKITLSGTSAPAQGFNITISGVFGRKLDDEGNGDSEVDVNGTSVNEGSGIFINSGLNGTYEIIRRISGTSIVVKKKRDINIRDTSDALYTRGGATGPKWTTGHGGAGYNGNAKAYFLGGGNTTMAVATATVSSGAVTGFNFTGTGNTRGAGYTHAPQVIISGGGWRKVGAANPNNVIQDGQILEATEGLVIIRKNPGPDGNSGTSDDGKMTYIKPKNPFN